MTAPAADGAGPRAIRHNAAVFARLIRIAHARAAAGRHASAMEWCRAAASFATTNPTGELRSAAIERVADLVAAAALAASPDREPDPRDGPRRVLHVISEARDIGGLTRMAERWIARDAGSVSSVVVTLQPAVIDSLRAAAEASGGSATALGPGDPVAHARRLRRLGEQADIVVCHLHPGDPVPAVAFGAGYRGAPVAFFNHSDHLFWWAPTRATLIVDFRDVGAELTRRGRGYPPDAMHRLPLLVPEPAAAPASPAHVAAFPPGSVTAVTVARAPKFQDTALRPRFSDLLSAALDDNPSLMFRAVGPLPTDAPWPALLRRHPGRIRVEGPVRDPRPFYDDADLYLDTFPFSSLTSLLEASAAGLPVVTLDGHRGLRRALGIADFAAADDDRPGTPDAHRARIAALVRDAGERRRAGERARALHASLVPDELWLDRAEELYARLRESARRGAHVGAHPAPAACDGLADHALAILAIEQRVPLHWMFGGGMPQFDRRDRVALAPRVLAARALWRAGRGGDATRRAIDRVLLPAAGGTALSARPARP